LKKYKIIYGYTIEAEDEGSAIDKFFESIYDSDSNSPFASPDSDDFIAKEIEK